jgi:hypothetical protein
MKTAFFFIAAEYNAAVTAKQRSSFRLDFSLMQHGVALCYGLSCDIHYVGGRECGGECD